MIFFLAPLPPPITGQTWVSREILDRLQSRQVDCSILNTSSGRLATASTRIIHLYKLLRVSLALLMAGSPRGGTLYISLNANIGMAFSVLHALIARLYRHRIFIHHHTAAHINRERTTMRWLSRVVGRNGVHICQCRTMGEALARRYPAVERIATLSNAAFIARPPQQRAAAGGPFTLGHMSNLSRAKGLGHVLDLFEALLERDVDVELQLAGPCREPAAAELLASAQARHPARLRYLGQIGGEEKTAFFHALDLFVFPSEYANETQGVVNLEALAHGVPVAAYGRCCIPDDLNDAGLVVPVEAGFVQAVVPYVLEMTARPELVAAARQRAYARFDELAADALQELHELLDSLQHSEPCTRRVARV
jgi:glycosyltransferase involved in cell wall biosynthesis